MNYTLAILFYLLHILSVTTAAPLSVEVIMKNKVKLSAEQLMKRLDNFEAPPGLKLSPTADELNSTYSIVNVLDRYNSRISDTFDGVPQVKSEISSLTGYLYQWRQLHCDKQPPKPLQELQSRKYPETQTREALARVKEFLNLLLKNLDQLQSC